MNIVGEERACFVAYPAQPKSANGSKCWNWFKPGDQQRDAGSPRSSPASHARSRATTRSTGSASMLLGYRPAGRPRPSWAPPTPTSTRRSGCIPACRAVPPATSLRRSRPCVGVAPGPEPRASFVRIRRRRPACPDHRLPWRQRCDRASAKRASRHRAVSLDRSCKLRSVTQRGHAGGRTYSRTSHFDASGQAVLEMWVVHGAGHAWSGGSPAGRMPIPGAGRLARWSASFSSIPTRQRNRSEWNLSISVDLIGGGPGGSDRFRSARTR